MSVIREAVAQRCFVKKVCSEISQNLQGKTYARVSYLIKLPASGLLFYQKRDSGTGVFPCFSYGTPPVAVSENIAFSH